MSKFRRILAAVTLVVATLGLFASSPVSPAAATGHCPSYYQDDIVGYRTQSNATYYYYGYAISYNTGRMVISPYTWGQNQQVTIQAYGGRTVNSVTVTWLNGTTQSFNPYTAVWRYGAPYQRGDIWNVRACLV